MIRHSIAWQPKIRVSIVLSYSTARTWQISGSCATKLQARKITISSLNGQQKIKSVGQKKEQHIARKLLGRQLGNWLEVLVPAGYGSRRIALEYPLYMRLCRTAYPIFSIVVCILSSRRAVMAGAASFLIRCKTGS